MILRVVPGIVYLDNVLQTFDQLSFFSWARNSGHKQNKKSQSRPILLNNVGQSSAVKYSTGFIKKTDEIHIVVGRTALQ